MAGRSTSTWWWRGIGVLLLLGVAVWTGCSTPRERYRVLSFFFDGVPDPDKPVRVAVASTQEGPMVATLTIVSKHKPYAEGRCSSCHRSSAGEIMEFEEAYKLCGTCHTKVRTQHAVMHGPVAQGACDWCHVAHDSTEPALLKEPPLKVCTKCHDQQMLSATPSGHNDGSNCLSCHKGHGGPERYFLVKGWQDKWAAVRPASRPATQPATAPAGTSPSTVPSTRAGAGAGA